MGLDASAELIWGIPVKAYDEDGTATPFWSEEDEDWRRFEGDLTLVSFGGMDCDDEQAILTSTLVEHYHNWCGEDPLPLRLPDLSVSAEGHSRATEAARANGLDVDFHAKARWNLVASYG